ncbi:uncharacterized [Tachysurus ichikawai]
MCASHLFGRGRQQRETSEVTFDLPSPLRDPLHYEIQTQTCPCGNNAVINMHVISINLCRKRAESQGARRFRLRQEMEGTFGVSPTQQHLTLTPQPAHKRPTDGSDSTM